jgi:hypothetical protein
MSRAFREGKTEKTKSALNLFYAVFFERNSKEMYETGVSNKELLIKTRWIYDLSSKILTKCLG